MEDMDSENQNGSFIDSKHDDETFEPPTDLGVDWNETLIDVVLSAGDLLYIPRAFPHEVSMVESDDISVHLIETD